MSKYENKFKIGNVIRLSGGSLVIASSVNSKNIGWVSFSYCNSSGITDLEPTERVHMCMNCYPCPDEDCEDCKGSGEVKTIEEGMKGAIVVAECVKDYILESLTKNFKNL